MLILFDFECSICDAVTEKLVQRDVHTITCECGHEMERLVSTPRVKLEGYSGDFPGAALKWERQHEKAAKETPQG